MKNNFIDFTAAGEVTDIVCDIKNVEMHLFPTDESDLKISYESDKDAQLSFDEGVLKVSFDLSGGLFAHKQKIVNIYVPDHAVPKLSISCADCDIYISSALFDMLGMDAERSRLMCDGTSFSQCSITGALDVIFKGVTVKGAFVVKSAEGDVLCENCFAAHAECRVKKGNIGLSGFNCKDSSFEAESGNITARLSGEESEYSLGLVIKEGTANRQSVVREGAVRSFNAYSATGNVTIDFMPDENTDFYGER